jgi:hypothetical protein
MNLGHGHHLFGSIVMRLHHPEEVYWNIINIKVSVKRIHDIVEETVSKEVGNLPLLSSVGRLLM